MLEFPDWTPPSDLGQLFLQTEPERITEVYRLIEMGEFDAARALIAEIDRQSLDWTPPAEDDGIPYACARASRVREMPSGGATSRRW